MSPQNPQGYNQQAAPVLTPEQQVQLQDIERGKGMAYLAYASIFLGFPVFILPLIQRDNPFSLYHARQAAGIYVLFFIIFAILMAFSFITLGFGSLAFPIVFIVWVPSIHGFMLVSRGEYREPTMLFGLGDKLFGGITLQQPGQAGYAPGMGQGQHPPQQGGYPPQQAGYPPQQGGYPPQQGGFAPAQGHQYAPQPTGSQPDSPQSGSTPDTGQGGPFSGGGTPPVSS